MKLSIQLTSLLLALASVQALSAQEVVTSKDPFEISKQNCIDKGWMDGKCLTTNEATGVFPLKIIIDDLNSTIERFRDVNGWGEEVTPETLVPIGATFAFG